MRLIAVGAFTLLACARVEKPTPQQDLPVARVRVAEAGKQAGGQWAAGTVVASQRASISTRIAARVKSVLVEEGARVDRGALLVRLEDADLRGQLDAAQTALEAARANERRVEKLVAAHVMPRAALDTARPQRAQAEAQVAAVKASLAYAEIRAPFAGVVQAKRVQPGDFAGPGQPLVDLEGGGLEIEATLSDAESRGLAKGDRLAFESDGTRGEAEILALTPGGDAVSHRSLLRARVLGAQALRSGSFARLRLPDSDDTGGVWVAKSALVERGDLTGVFVAEDGRAELRWLALGDSADGSVAVRAGLHPGERVVDAPGDLRDGQRVEVTGGP